MAHTGFGILSATVACSYTKERNAPLKGETCSKGVITRDLLHLIPKSRLVQQAVWKSKEKKKKESFIKTNSNERKSQGTKKYKTCNSFAEQLQRQGWLRKASDRTKRNDCILIHWSLSQLIGLKEVRVMFSSRQRRKCMILFLIK